MATKASKKATQKEQSKPAESAPIVTNVWYSLDKTGEFVEVE